MHILISFIVFLILIRVILRILGLGRGYRRPYYGYGPGFGYGRGRRHRFGGGLFSILALVALDRIFTRRY